MIRRDLIKRLALGAGGAWISGCAGNAPPATRPEIVHVLPPLPMPLVKEFVVAAHSDIAKVRTMLQEEPHLINATWDWKAGDFETALGGASHTGHVEIAMLLMASGARMDLFCATMLGRMPIVRACVTADPAIVHVKGPHGISLLRHAVVGKQEEVAEFLRASGAT